MAAVAERHADDAGIAWPMPVAPYEVVLTLLNPKDAASSDAAGGIYDALVKEGIEVLFDDRDERPGVKFNDADLIGIPYRLTPLGVEPEVVGVVLLVVEEIDWPRLPAESLFAEHVPHLLATHRVTEFVEQEHHDPPFCHVLTSRRRA